MMFHLFTALLKGSNIDAKASGNLTLQFNLFSVYEIRKASICDYNAGSFGEISGTVLRLFPSELPDPTKYAYANGSGAGSSKLVYGYGIAGYKQNNSQNLKGNFVADDKTPGMPGLSACGFFQLPENVYRQ